jgi:hypothetical protein
MITTTMSAITIIIATTIATSIAERNEARRFPQGGR